MSEHRQEFLDLKLRDRLSVADAIILYQRVGVTKAANFVVAAVGPWRFPHDLMMMPLRHLMLDVRYRVSWLRRHFWGEY